MKKTLDKAIKEKLCPLMFNEGYCLKNRLPVSKEWIFEKQTSDGRKIQIIVEYLKNMITSIRLDMGITPSQKYNSFEVNIPTIEWTGKLLEKNMYGGWTCHNADDVDTVVDYLIEIMKQFAFNYFDKVQYDLTDKPLTSKEHKELFDNHEQYVTQFAKRHNLSGWDFEEVICAMQDDLFQVINNDEVSHHLVYEIAAVYGNLLIKNGGKWTWDSKLSKATVQIPFRNMNTFDRVKFPLQDVMFFLQTKNTKDIRQDITGTLRLTGNM